MKITPFTSGNGNVGLRETGTFARLTGTREIATSSNVGTALASVPDASIIRQQLCLSVAKFLRSGVLAANSWKRLLLLRRSVLIGLKSTVAELFLNAPLLDIICCVGLNKQQDKEAKRQMK
jgi:hypothetical protein